MRDKKFDGFLKDSFSGYSPEVPAHIWENIADKRKKKKGAFFWLNERKALLALAVLLLAGSGIYLATNKKGSTQNIALENNGSRQGTESIVPAAVLPPANETGKAATSADNVNETSIENSETVITQNDKVSAGNEKLITDTFSTNEGTDKSSNTPAYNNSDKNDAANVVTTTRRKNKIQKPKRITQKTTNAQPVDVKDNTGDDDFATVDEVNILDVSGSRDLIILSKENIFPKQTIQAGAIKLKEDCPGNTSGNNYYVKAYISPDYAIKKYSDTGNSFLVSKRKESLRIQSAFSAGLRYTRVFANGMSVRTGFNFSQINEKFSYAQDNVVQIVYIINIAGDTTDSYYVRGTRYKNSYNRYRTIDVPLVVGYEMGNGRFHANINAGAVINLYSWQKGETLDNNGAPVTITTGKPDNPYQYKTNVGIGFTGAASLYYKFSDRFHFLAEPYFRYNFSPMNKEALSIQEKFTTIGLRLGVRVDLR
jgi:hypothetical protein